MAVFMHRMSAFENPRAMVFKRSPVRDKASLQYGDAIFIVGTGNYTRSILGMMMSSGKYVKGTKDFPYGVANISAWRFAEGPAFPLPFDRARFGTNSGQTVISLSADEAEQMFAIIPPGARIPIYSDATARTSASRSVNNPIRRGPPPSTSRTGIMHMRDAPACTYLLRVEAPDGKTLGFKIGWAFDHTARMAEFNKISAPGLGGLRYRSMLRHEWNSARLAFRMEQRFLDRFENALYAGNREVIVGIAEGRIERVWSECVQEVGSAPNSTSAPVQSTALLPALSVHLAG